LCLAGVLAFGQAQAQVNSDGTAQFRSVAGAMLQNHPELQARWLGAQAQDQLVGAAAAARLPRVDLNASAGSENTQRLDGAGNSIPLSGSTNRTTLVGRLPIYDGSEVASETQRQQRLTNVRVLELRQAEDQLLAELARAWHDVIRNRMLIDVAHFNVRAHERLLALVEQRVISGAGRGVDLEQARARLASARLGLSSDQGQLAEASARYARFALGPADPALGGLALAAFAVPSSEREAWRFAIKGSSALQASAEAFAASESEVAVRRSVFKPRVAVEARHDLNARTAAIPNAASSSIALTFNYNLFAGGGDVARREDASLRSMASRRQFQDTATQLRQTVSSTWAEVVRQQAVYQQAASYAESILKTRQAYRQQYEIGQRSLLDLLNTENEVAQAQRLHINAWADARNALIRLVSLTGQLAEAFGVERRAASLRSAGREFPISLDSLSSNLSDEPLNLQTIPPGVTLLPQQTVVATALVQDPPPSPPAAALPTAPSQTPRSPVRANAPAAVPAVVLGTALAGAPAPMVTALGQWREAVGSGFAPQIEQWYSIDGSPAAPRWWPAQDAPKAQRLDIVRAEWIQAEPSTIPTAQVQLVLRFTQGSVSRCLRSNQQWRMQQRGSDQHWHIVRERTIDAPAELCTSLQNLG
jgi:adhesin transport system outer membrane protein